MSVCWMAFLCAPLALLLLVASSVSAQAPSLLVTPAEVKLEGNFARVQLVVTAADASGQVSGDAYAQTVKTLANVRRALELAGAKPDHVVRSTIFLQNIDDWEAVGRAHGELFGEIRPAATMIEVSRFIAPEMLIEIQVDAVISD